MVEFNLLPDIKLEYLKTKRLEHLVTVISTVVGCLAVAVFVFLFVYTNVYQKVKLDNLNTQIGNYSASLKSNSSLDQILTVQNQLETLPSLEAQAPTTSRLFGYIAQVTPINATISSLNVNYSTNSIVISGNADSLATVNTYIDTLKYSTFDDTTTGVKNQPAFNTIVLSSFNYTNNASSSGQSAQYSITCNFAPVLFKSTDKISLIVPNEITTQSILNQPVIFKASDSSSSGS